MGRVVGYHQGLEHTNAMTRVDKFMKICNNQEKSIVEFGSNAYREKVDRNKQTFSVVKTIVLLGKQNIALRGKTEERSNFKALIN